MLPGIKLWDIIGLFEKLTATDLEPVFVHSLDVAKLSAAMARIMGLNPTDAYIGGLFHDIGVAVYSRLIERKHGCRDGLANTIKINWGQVSFDFSALVMDIDKDNIHSLISYLLLKQLDLVPESVLGGVLYHHTCKSPDVPPESEKIAQIFCVADDISQVYRKYLFDCPSLSYSNLVDLLNSLPFKGIDEDVVDAAWKVVRSEMCMSYIFDHFGYPGRFGVRNIGVGFSRLTDLFRILVILTDMRSEFTRYHSIQIAMLARDLTLEMLRTDRDAESLYLAGLVHDIGKMKIPINILHKPGELTVSERALMRTHVVETFKMLEGLTGINEVVRIAAAHHERLDGSGYPLGLTAEDMPLKARILQVADVFVALTENRPYRTGIGCDSVLGFLWDLVSDFKVDGYVVETLDRMIRAGYEISLEEDPVNIFFTFASEDEVISYVKKEVFGIG